MIEYIYNIEYEDGEVESYVTHNDNIKEALNIIIELHPNARVTYIEERTK